MLRGVPDLADQGRLCEPIVRGTYYGRRDLLPASWAQLATGGLLGQELNVIDITASSYPVITCISKGCYKGNVTTRPFSLKK